MENRTYKGIDLLEKILEFVEMTPNSKEWNVIKLASNPPRKIRLKQIESLISAFYNDCENKNPSNKSLSTLFNKKEVDIKSILSGEFIALKTIDDYKPTTEFINNFVKNHIDSSDVEKEIHLNELIFIYTQLLEYKKRIRNLVKFNSGWIEAGSTASQFSILLTNSITKNLEDKYNELDKTLELIINPNELTFSEQELIDRYDYPSESLFDIEMEWM